MISFASFRSLGRAGIFSLLVACTGTSFLRAEDSAPSQAARPPAARPDTPPKTKMALKLAGLVSFVASSCRDMQPDYAKFKSAVGALGVSYSDLDKMELKAEYLSYAMRYKENISGNCARALTDFGPGGKVIADLVKPQAK